MLPRAMAAAGLVLLATACKGPERLESPGMGLDAGRAEDVESIALDASPPAMDAAPAAAPDAGDMVAPDAGELDAMSSPDATPAHDAALPDIGPAVDAGLPLWNPRSGPPPKKGLWIWYFAYTGFTAQQIAEQCVQDGIGYVLIKSGQDGSYWSTRYNEANLREFTSRGITVFGWPYMTPNDIPNSINAAVQAAQVPGSSGIILDVEVEWEGTSPSQYAQSARDLCNGIRQGAPGVFLGYTSFGWIGYHSNLPFADFDATCGDAFMPQVYWSDRGVSWSYGYNQAVQMLNAAGLHAPVWMIQSNDATPSGTRPSTIDLNAFFMQAGAYTSLYEWPAAGNPTLVAQLPMLHFSNP
jgi:hypothetical protein